MQDRIEVCHTIPALTILMADCWSWFVILIAEADCWSLRLGPNKGLVWKNISFSLHKFLCNPPKNGVAYTENRVSWNFKNLRLSKVLLQMNLFEFFFLHSYLPNNNWILVLCFGFRSWNFPFFPYTGFCVRAIQNMRRVHRFLNNLHRIFNCSYCIQWLIGFHRTAA